MTVPGFLQTAYVEPWELGRAIRRWWDRLVPVEVGVRAGARRRAVGLRREELAGLAGISVDYLTRLEQGRATSPSPGVVESLARALRLSDIEREHLFRLSGHPPPGSHVVSSRVTSSVQRLLDRLADTPVAVHDATWSLLLANAPYDALMGDTTAWRGIERNGVWRNLVGPGTRVVHTPREQSHFEARLVADLRLSAARYPHDPRVTDLVDQLSSGSPRFVDLWESAEAPEPSNPSRHKIIAHPEVGHISLDCDTLIEASDDLRITVYTAEPGSADAERLALALVLGTQALVERS